MEEDDDFMQETFKETQQKAKDDFCRDLNPKSKRDKPFVDMCKEFKKQGIEPNDIVKELYNNPYVQFFNPRYIVMAKIYENNSGNLGKFCKNNNLDVADFIRYIEINKNFL